MKPPLSFGSPNKEKKNILILMLGMFAAGILTMAVSTNEIRGSLIVFMAGFVFFAAGVLCLRSYLKDKQKVQTP